MAKKKRVPKPNELSLAQLQQMVDSKASQLMGLRTKRAKVQQELDELDRLIQQTEGTQGQKSSVAKKSVAGSTSATRPGKKKKKVAKKGKGTRAKNARSAKSIAEEILKKEPQGLSLNELADRVLANGFKSNSVSFKNTLYQSLYNSRKAGKIFDFDDKTGLWFLR